MRFRLSSAVICASIALTGCGERIALENTGISVEVPGGFKRDTQVFASWPLLRFVESQPLFAYPEIELSLAHGHSVEPKSPDEYLFSRRKDLRDKLLFGPANTTVDGRPAVEVAIRSQIVAMVIGPGGGGAADVITHDIEFLHGTKYYVCRLTAYPDQYGRYVDDLRDFCESVRFADQDSQADST